MNSKDLSKLLNNFNFNHIQNENPSNKSNQFTNISENKVSNKYLKMNIYLYRFYPIEF